MSTLAGGSDPNVISIYGKTPLYEASEKHRIGMVQVLLLGGAEPDKACIKSGRTPLHEAAKCREPIQFKFFCLEDWFKNNLKINFDTFKSDKYTQILIV